MKKIILIPVAIFFVFLFSCNKKTPTQQSNFDLNKTNNNLKNSTQIGIVDFPNSSIKNQTEIKNKLLIFYSGGINNQNRPGKLKKWIKAHIGTHLFNNCDGKSQCGPCPGICIPLGRNSVITNDSTYNDNNQNDEQRIFNLTQLETDEFVISFVRNDEFVINNVFYVTADTELSENIANAFGFTKLIIKQGAYPLTFEFNSNGETVIDVITE